MIPSQNITKQVQTLKLNDADQQYRLSPANTILRQQQTAASVQQLPRPPVFSTGAHIAYSTETEKPIYILQQNSQPQKYLQTPYIQLIPSSEQPIASNNIDEPDLRAKPVKLKPAILSNAHIRPQQAILTQNTHSNIDNIEHYSNIKYVKYSASVVIGVLFRNS